MSVYTQSDLDKLKKAMLTGERRVTFSDGRTVEFQSAEELGRRIEYVRRELEAETGRQRLLAEFSKGVQS